MGNHELKKMGQVFEVYFFSLNSSWNAAIIILFASIFFSVLSCFL